MLAPASPRSAPLHQRQDGEGAAPVVTARWSLPMQPFDLTKAAYSLEVVGPTLRELDATGQALVVMMGPGAERTLADARRFHVAVSNLPHIADFIERLAIHEDQIFTLLSALERGDDVRLICTPKYAPAAPADELVPLARSA